MFKGTNGLVKDDFTEENPIKELRIIAINRQILLT